MTEPVEEEVKAPLDDPDEDEVRTARTLDTISSLEDLETLKTPEAPEDVSDAVDAGVEADEEEELEEQEEGEAEEDAMVLPLEEEPGAPPEEEPLPPDSHIVKINGEEYQLTTEDLVAGYQQAAASQQKFQRASEVEKAAHELVNNVLDPDKAVNTMIDLYSDRMEGDRDKASEVVDEIIGKRIQDLIDLEEMTDEERQLHNVTQEKDRMASALAERQAYDEEMQRQEYVKYQNTQAVPLLDGAISAYNLEVGSAEDVESSQILAEYIRQGHTVTQELANQTVADVLNRRRGLLQSTLNGMSAEELLSTNPELAQQVQAQNVADIKASRSTQTGANQGSTPKRRRKAKKSTDEYTDSNEFFNDTDF